VKYLLREESMLSKKCNEIIAIIIFFKIVEILSQLLYNECIYII